MSTTSLAQCWHPIATVEEVGGQPKQFILLDEPLVAFRDQQGVAVFKDLCIHRGSALSRGWIENGNLTCAYHGWQYDRSGACVHIPSLPEGSTIPSKARAITVRAVEAYDLIWVALEEPSAELPSFPENEWDDPDFHGFVSHHYVWQTSAGRSVENFLDISHFPFVHEGILGSRDKTVMAPHTVEETDYGITYYYEEEEPASLHSKPGDVIRWQYDLYSPFTIHLTKTAPRGEKTLISMAASPTSPKQSNLFLWIVRNHSLGDDDQAYIDFTGTIMEQDRPVVESQRPEAIPTDLRDELHLKVPDASGIAYRRLLGKIEHAEAFAP